MEYTKRTPKKKEKKRRKKDKTERTSHPQKPEGTKLQQTTHKETLNPQKSPGLHHHTERTLLPLPWLKQLPLSSKLIEHSKFLSSLLPFALETETTIS
jgi:hypothetical protein